MNRSGRRTLVVAVILGVIAVAVIIVLLRPKPAVSAGPPAEVMVAQVQQKDVAIYSEWIGTLDGLVNANVKAQVTGYLLEQNYQEGSFVQKGQLLFQIDPRPFQAVLDQAEGQLAQAKAQLANAEAVQLRNQLDVDRYTPLAKEQAASQQDLDNAIQNNRRPRWKPRGSIWDSRGWSRRLLESLESPSCKWARWSIPPALPSPRFRRSTPSKFISPSAKVNT
jgi:multidrug efflux pump subunit AcrA (membrane-fusion protein)